MTNIKKSKKRIVQKEINTSLIKKYKAESTETLAKYEVSIDNKRKILGLGKKSLKSKKTKQKN